MIAACLGNGRRHPFAILLCRRGSDGRRRRCHAGRRGRRRGWRRCEDPVFTRYGGYRRGGGLHTPIYTRAGHHYFAVLKVGVLRTGKFAAFGQWRYGRHRHALRNGVRQHGRAGRNRRGRATGHQGQRGEEIGCIAHVSPPNFSNAKARLPAVNAF
ncbi:hypothetical protein BMF35_a1316 [Aurantiacibacter gangjinensis]|nr:hypothetical protein BMF35_a1316 [Aurantiacibacter gangjinensis]